MTITSNIAYEIRPTIRYHLYSSTDTLDDLNAWAISEGFDTAWAAVADPAFLGGGAAFWQEDDGVHIFQDGTPDGVIIADGFYISISGSISINYYPSANDFHAVWSETP